jgi:IS30 family transposase
VSTIAREVHRNGGRRRYVSWEADLAARERARRPKVRRLVADRVLAAVVEEGLRQCWSPAQIAGRLRLEHPDDPRWWVSPETIYQSLFLQGRGGLQRELLAALRTGRTRRWPEGRNPWNRNGHIKNMILISQRPAEVADRAVPGHWEGDLLIGSRAGPNQIGTLVERTSRFTMLVHLPENRQAETVRDAITRKVRHLPAALARTLTWDQGHEMAGHARFTIDTGIQVFFCDPHSPWQRGTNENTNGLLRQYFAKGGDYHALTEADLDTVADELNGRPRKTLGYRTPAEVFSDLIVATTP